MSSPLRVVVADDHPFYRQNLARALRASGIDVVAEAPNGEAALRAVEERTPDVVVMDLMMPGMSGLEATRRLGGGTRVLMLSVSVDETDVSDAMLAGASGYVLKDQPVEEVIAGVEAAAAGGFHVSADVAVPLLRRLQERGGDLAGVPLSSREHEVLVQVGLGRTGREIAQALGVAPECIGADAAAILAKLWRAGPEKVG